MEMFSGGGVEMRFFTDLERSLFCGVEMEKRGEDDEYGGVVDRCPMMKG